MRYRKTTGDRGESAAESILRAKGYRIVDRKYHTPYGELDIVARDGGYLVFVEVKTRAVATYGSGLEAITRTKKRRLSRAAQIYLLRNGIHNQSCRFDVIALQIGRDGEAASYTHIPAAFDFEGGNYY